MLGAYRRVLEKLYYMDDLYRWAFINPVLSFRLSLAWFDRKVIDRVVDFMGESVVWICSITERLDRRSLGMKRGAQLAGASSLVAALALVLSSSEHHAHWMSVDLGPLGLLTLKTGVVEGVELALALALVSTFVLVRGGVSKAAATAIGFLFVGAGLFGAEAGWFVSKWAAGDPSGRLYMNYLSHHPLRAGTAALLGWFVLVTWWAGLGVDGSVRWVAETAILTCGRVIRTAQTGRLQEYLFATIVGIVDDHLHRGDRLGRAEQAR